ncbi:MAG: sigma-70 family RNA polymerase sigma factor [Dehalococcoidia bacterium]|jgi:RNA polymerase sigma-70 factor, ECF subfamily
MTIASSTSQSYETKLVEKLHSADSAAMEEFYNLYRTRLYTLILEQVDRDEAVAEDLVQEVFLAALGSLDKFRGDSQLYTWLRSIALHKINDFYRRQTREPKPEKSLPDFSALELEQIGDDGQAILNTMESEEIRQSVHQALAGLPQDYQDVLVLKYLKDMPVLAISQIMGRSPKSVEGLLSRARKAMRDNLGNNHNHHEP